MSERCTMWIADEGQCKFLEGHAGKHLAPDSYDPDDLTHVLQAPEPDAMERAAYWLASYLYPEKGDPAPTFDKDAAHMFDELLTELYRARQDSRRLDWLEEFEWKHGFNMTVEERMKHPFWAHLQFSSTVRNRVRDAIDRAQ